MSDEYTAKLFAKGDSEKLFECISSAQVDFDRSGFTIKKVENGLEFEVVAKDAVALRATLNTISQSLIIFESVKGE